jgi:hypothetical protein
MQHSGPCEKRPVDSLTPVFRRAMTYNAIERELSGRAQIYGGPPRIAAW